MVDTFKMQSTGEVLRDKAEGVGMKGLGAITGRELREVGC